jgi:hypothetical protein
MNATQATFNRREWLYIGVGIKDGELPFDLFLKRLEAWKDRWTAGRHWMPMIRPWLPPIVLDMYIRFHAQRRGIPS